MSSTRFASDDVAAFSRTLIKAGLTNAEYMAMTSKEVRAEQLKEIGIYNVVVNISFSFPKRQKTDDPETDKKNYLSALEIHNDDTGLLVLPKGLGFATCPLEEIPKLKEKDRHPLTTKQEIELEVARRKIVWQGCPLTTHLPSG